MGMIASDFWLRLGGSAQWEEEYEAGELLESASPQLQAMWGTWAEANGDRSYVPGEILKDLLGDDVFLEAMLDRAEHGDYINLSGARFAVNREHLRKMGLTVQDLAENLCRSLDREEELSDSVQFTVTGGDRVAGLYLFANGWLGVETERRMEPVRWDEPAQDWDGQEGFDGFGGGGAAYGMTGSGGLDEQGDDVWEPSVAYLFSEEGELIASPDIRGGIEDWMSFVDMFSAVSEEATPSDAGRVRTEPADRERSYIVYSPDVEAAMAAGKPVVLIESAATFTGMMYPGIAEFAKKMQETIRAQGAMPAYAAILGGQIHIGLTDKEILYLEERRGTVFRAATRDIPVLLAMRADGVLTIAAAIKTASLAGIRIVCASGIGGAQIGAAQSMDISTDLEALASEPVTVVCSGPKPVLDLPLTMQYLETAGVPVIGYRTDSMPDYLTRDTQIRLNYRMDDPVRLAEVMHIKERMGIGGGILVVNPIPQESALDTDKMDAAVAQAMEDVRRNNIRGKAITNFLMGRLKAYVGEESMESQKAFLLSNATLAAELAAAYAKLPG